MRPTNDLDLPQLRAELRQMTDVELREFVRSASQACEAIQLQEATAEWRRRKASHMNVFKTFALKWWQTSLFKLGMLALGIAVGAYWHDFFGGYLVILMIVASVSLAYITFEWWKQ